MKLGVFLAYWPWLSLEEQVRLAAMADEGGLDSVWVAESYGYDVVSVLALLAAKTRRIAVGTGVMQIPARKPTTAAMSAAALDAISGGRLRLGLGVSGPQVSEGWYGVPFGSPLRRTKDYISTVRRALDRQPIQLPLDPGASTGLGKPIRLLAPPVQHHIPIYLGAMGPKAVTQCFEIADGWFPFPVGLEMLSLHQPPADRPFDVSPALPLAIADTIDKAREDVRPWLTFYFGAMGHATKNVFVDLAQQYGYGNAAKDVQRRYVAGDTKGAAEALTPELIDATSIATTPDRLNSRLSEYEGAGASSVVAIVCGDRERAIKRLIALT